MLYLASPYTKFGDLDAAYVQACRATALLMRAGIPVFSAIVHGHPLVEEGGLPVDAPEFWRKVNRPFMEMSSGLIVLRLNGWRSSEGVIEEITWFHAVGRPVIYMDAGRVPEELLAPPSPEETLQRWGT